MWRVHFLQLYRSIDTLHDKLLEESIVVAAVCVLFLWHVRSALVAIIALPVTSILSFSSKWWLRPLEQHVVF
jgi:Cu(I)/Ag(I) efflux system membrane protein CusA/SilA